MRIFLGDLGHYTIRLTNNHTPINIGYIAGYLKKHFGAAVEISLFKRPELLIQAIKTNPPDLLGLSNYIWCQAISELVFRFFKQAHPSGLTLWGGPNFPINEPEKILTFMRERPYVDFYVGYEGEEPALHVVRSWLEDGPRFAEIREELPERFGGCFFITTAGLLACHDIGIQTPDLGDIPSPYLEGWMDPFLEEGLHAMIETQRGCPYQCAFCHTGHRYYNRMRRFPPDRVRAEIEHIVKTVPDPRKTHLYIADTNFGMWPEDMELAKWLSDLYARTGFPLSFGTNTGKGKIDLVLKTVKCHPKLMLTNSVQSLDVNVLKEIKRVNLPMQQLVESQDELEREGKLSSPEVILALPLETRESHLNTLRRLIHEVRASIIYQYTLMLLPGTALYSDASRAKYHYEVRYRLLPTSFGEYLDKRCVEIEEVSVGTKDMSYAEYLEMRELFFFIHNIYSNSIYRSMVQFLIQAGADIIDFFLFLSRARKALANDSLPNRVVQEYLRETEEELFHSREELIRFYTDDTHWTELRQGFRGRNLTHTYRAILLKHSAEWAHFVLQGFRDFLETTNSVTERRVKISVSVCRHVQVQAECQSRLLRGDDNIPDFRNPIRLHLEHNVLDLVPLDFCTPGEFVFSYYLRDDAIEYFRSLPKDQNIVDLALFVLRMDKQYLLPLIVKSDYAVLKTGVGNTDD